MRFYFKDEKPFNKPRLMCIFKTNGVPELIFGYPQNTVLLLSQKVRFDVAIKSIRVLG